MTNPRIWESESWRRSRSSHGSLMSNHDQWLVIAFKRGISSIKETVV